MTEAELLALLSAQAQDNLDVLLGKAGAKVKSNATSAECARAIIDAVFSGGKDATGNMTVGDKDSMEENGTALGELVWSLRAHEPWGELDPDIISASRTTLLLIGDVGRGTGLHVDRTAAINIAAALWPVRTAGLRCLSFFGMRAWSAHRAACSGVLTDMILFRTSRPAAPGEHQCSRGGGARGHEANCWG